MVLPEEKELKPAENGNLLLCQTPYVSSSYEEYGWTKNQLTDGCIGMNVSVHQGWCSMIGSKTRDITEWVMFALGKPITISVTLNRRAKPVAPSVNLSAPSNTSAMPTKSNTTVKNIPPAF